MNSTYLYCEDKLIWKNHFHIAKYSSYVKITQLCSVAGAPGRCRYKNNKDANALFDPKTSIPRNEEKNYDDRDRQHLPRKDHQQNSMNRNRKNTTILVGLLTGHCEQTYTRVKDKLYIILLSAG